MPPGTGTSAVDVTTIVGATAGPVGSPLWWLDVANRKLEARRPLVQLCDDYYEGDHRLLFATTKFREAFGDLFAAFSDNWCEVVVDAAAERLMVEGFRFGDDEKADDDAWDTWQRNGLDAESSLAMLEAVKLGNAAVLVEAVDGGTPIITVEHPSQAIVLHEAGNRRKRAAGFKKWQDDDGIVYATLYRPEGAYRFRTKEALMRGSSAFDAQWVERVDAPHFVRYGPLAGVVPMVPLANNPTLLRGGRSDLLKVIPLQDAVNKLVTDMMVASEFAAFRQRLLTGVEVPKYPEGHEKAGEPMQEAFISAVSRLMVVENPDARAQEFGQTDLTNYVKAVEMLVQHLAAQTRTPPHYLVGSIVNASGDALKAAETGLVAKARSKMKHFGEAWEEVARLGFRAQGDKRADAPKVETLWGDPESRSLAEVADAAVKMQTLGVPQEALWERLGASAQERKEWLRMQEEQAKRAGLAPFTPTGLPNEPVDPTADPTPAPA